MATLFDEDNSNDDQELKINQDYADKYNQWREKEEYQKLKDKYGEGTANRLIANGSDLSDSSDTSESEDDEGEAWGSDVEQRFFHTLASLKTKDPSIYDNSKAFFDKTQLPAPPRKKSEKEERMTLRDYERKMILEKGGRMSEDEEAPPAQTFVAEQEQLKKSFKNALQDSDSENDTLLTLRPKTSVQQAKEDEEYKEWLKGQKEDISNEDIKSKLKPLKDYWSDPKLDENEKFLKDFFLNKRYKDPDDKGYIPTYDEVVRDPDEENLSEDEKTLEQQLQFEHKYNFRFEEPDPEFIKRYPRTITNSLRKPDTSRKQKRDEVKERKKREKEQKKEELKQLKKYKLNEIREKLEQLKTITGNASLPFQDDDFEKDFNPEEYDRKMGELFCDDYYQVEEGDQKPEFPYDPEIDDENWDAYTGEAGPSTSGANDDYYEPHCEDPDFNMDCDYDENAKKANMDEMVEMSRGRTRGRKKSLFAKKLEAKKPVFDPKEHPNYEEYLEEYYKLDYEDIIGDQPVRFKYRFVVPNDFGLDTEEILSARDKELNQWCSVKKMSQYRPEHEETIEKKNYSVRRNNVKLKKKILPSLFVENSEELLVEDQETDRKKRRKRQGKEDQLEQPQDINLAQGANAEPILAKKKRKNKDKAVAQASVEPEQPKVEPETIDFSSGKNDESVVAKKRKKNKSQDTPPPPSDLEPQTTESETAKLTIEALVTSEEKVQKKKRKSEKQDAEPEPKKVKLATSAEGNKTATGQTVTRVSSVQSAEQNKGSNASSSATTVEIKKKKNKKKKKKKNSNGPSTGAPAVASSNNQKAKKKTKKVTGINISDDRLKAYGLNPKKFKNSLIYGKSKQS